tara:strand:- start:400 stop:768 length:369 start_codon:yes stop_codon:yes gene_type:complete
MNSFAQSLTEKDKSVINQNTENGITTFTYRLFPTQNMWTFIKLNTRNGQMWQVQYSMEENNRFESSLSLTPLVEKNNEIDNRFTLYSTQNTWTFILLDQIDGRTWQVQWSIEPDKRGIIPIE